MQENEICKLACVSIKKVPNSFLVIHWAPWQLACFKRTTKFDVFALPRQEQRRRAQWSIFKWRHCRHVGGPKQYIFCNLVPGVLLVRSFVGNISRGGPWGRDCIFSPLGNNMATVKTLYCSVKFQGKHQFRDLQKGKVVLLLCIALHNLFYFLNTSLFFSRALMPRLHKTHLPELN